VNITATFASKHLDSEDGALARTALHLTTDHAEADEWFSKNLIFWLRDGKVSARRLQALMSFCGPLLEKPGAQKLITGMLSHAATEVRDAALNVIASQKGGIVNNDWLPLIDKALTAAPTPLASMAAWAACTRAG
jgi:hypothetical protein